MIAVSIVIPTLNEASNIARLLRALQAQEYSAREVSQLEIVVCDGGSDDGTSEIVRAHDGVLLLESGRGVSRQRNEGAHRARGDLIIWMDADDLPPKQFVSRVARAYQKLPFAIACPWFTARDSGVLVRAIYFGFNILFALGQSTVRTGSGVCLIAPKVVWQKCGGFDESLHLGEDIKFIRSAAPRYGLHRHLLVPLETSGRRFAQKGAWNLIKFYALISPLILLGQWRALQKIKYEAALYD